MFVLNAKEIGLAFHAQKTGFSFLTLNFSKDNFRLFLNFISLSAMPFTVLLYFIFRHDQSYHSNLTSKVAKVSAEFSKRQAQTHKHCAVHITHSGGWGMTNMAIQAVWPYMNRDIMQRR